MVPRRLTLPAGAVAGEVPPRCPVSSADLSRNLSVDAVGGDTPVPKLDGKVVHEGGRAAQIEIGIARRPKFLDRVHIQASGSVEIDSQPVPWTWRAVADVAVAAGQSLEESARLCGERMLAAVTGPVNPPDLPRRGPSGQCMEHGECRGCAHTGTQQDNRSVASPQREAAAWRACFQNVANPNLSLDVGPGRAAGLPLDAQTIAIVARLADSE